MPKPMTPTPAKELVAQTLRTLVPSQARPRGVEDGTAEDLVFPRYQIVQEKSQLFKLGHKLGWFVNSITNKPVETFQFVPVKMTKYVDILRKDGAKMIFDHRVFDLNSPELAGRRYFNDRVTGDRADANRVIAFSGLVDSMPATISFKKTSYDTGKQLNSMIVFSKQDAWNYIYTISAVETAGKDGSYYVIKAEPAGETTPEMRKTAEYYYQLFGGKPAETMVGTTDGEEQVPF